MKLYVALIEKLTSSYQQCNRTVVDADIDRDALRTRMVENGLDEYEIQSIEVPLSVKVGIIEEKEKSAHRSRTLVLLEEYLDLDNDEKSLNNLKRINGEDAGEYLDKIYQTARDRYEKDVDVNNEFAPFYPWLERVVEEFLENQIVNAITIKLEDNVLINAHFTFDNLEPDTKIGVYYDVVVNGKEVDGGQLDYNPAWLLEDCNIFDHLQDIVDDYAGEDVYGPPFDIIEIGTEPNILYVEGDD